MGSNSLTSMELKDFPLYSAAKSDAIAALKNRRIAIERLGAKSLSTGQLRTGWILHIPDVPDDTQMGQVFRYRSDERKEV